MNRSIAMTEIPKIVGQRLRATAGDPVHPEPNLLSAFADNALTKPERRDVIEHLSLCADCRRVVALAVPQPEMVVPVAASSHGWLPWPVLRWASLGACGVIVAMAVMLVHPRQGTDSLIATSRTGAATELKSAPAVSNPAAEQGPSATSIEPHHSGSGSVAPGKSLFSAAPSQPSATTAPVQLAKNNSREIAKFPNQPLTNSTETADPLANAELAELMPGRAKDALQEPGDGMVASGAALEGQPESATSDEAEFTTDLVPRWALSADGTLERSLDSGRNWKTITVSNRTIFRALAANGLDIWVGGSGGALYHSSDAGEHWLRVQPQANGESLSTDIIGVEFPDAQDGKVTTSSQGIWTTTDAGQSWQKQ
jgi:hypothetical protein